LNDGQTDFACDGSGSGSSLFEPYRFRARTGLCFDAIVADYDRTLTDGDLHVSHRALRLLRKMQLREQVRVLIATGEGYNTKDSCMGGIESIKQNAPTAEVKDLTLAK